MSVASHLVLDIFAGYTPILWPLYGYLSSPSLTPSAQLLTKPITFQPFQSLDAPVFTGEGIILSAVLLMRFSSKLSRYGGNKKGELAFECY